MSFTQAFRMSIKSILSNKIRTLLTMLGIIIGVSSVIILISLVQGSTDSIKEQLESMGTNRITVFIMGRGSNRNVTEQELDDFADKNSDVIECVAPLVSGNVTLKAGSTNISSSLEGTNEAYVTVNNIKMTAGRFLNYFDVERKQKVALVGTYVANELYGSADDSLGKNIKINGDLFTVVGVLGERQSSTQQSQDDKVIIPISTAKRLLRNSRVGTFYVQGKTAETVSEAMDKLNEFLLKIYNSTDAYRVQNQADMLENVNNMTQTLTMMLGGIAGISLLVGGIGIMNIMLVSVTERTREIGIRKAIGAKRSNILTQFLIESIVVSCMGGIAGVLIGLGGGYGIGNLIGTPAKASLDTIIMSFSFSLVVGVFFGLYPANKASKLNPIEALRFE